VLVIAAALQKLMNAAIVMVTAQKNAGTAQRHAIFLIVQISQVAV
jgi:hypothetical protein